MLINRRGIATALLCFTSFFLSAQSKDSGARYDVEIFGNVSECKKDRPVKAIPEALVLLVLNEDTVRSHADKKGNYSLSLDYGEVYKIHFRSGDLCSKYVEINTADIPLKAQKGGFQMHVDMTLPNDARMLEIMILEDFPIGKAAYSKRTDNFAFDLRYTKRVRGWLDRGKKTS